MPSLSKAVLLNGWMTIPSWVLYLGFSTIVISAPAGAQPLAGSEASQPDLRWKPSPRSASHQPASHQPEVQPESESGQPAQFSPAQPFIPLGFSNSADSSFSSSPAAETSPVQPAPRASLQTALAHSAGAAPSSQDSHSEATQPDLEPALSTTGPDAGAAIPDQTNAPSDGTTQQPAGALSSTSSSAGQTTAELPNELLNGSPNGLTNSGLSGSGLSGSGQSGSASAESATSVTISAETCLADCNPSERFFFNPPANLAIPPRSRQQPMLAQNRTPSPLPVPTAPVPNSSAGAIPPNSPPPISTPLTRPAPDLAPTPDFTASADAAPLQSPSAETGSAADLAETGSRRALTPPSLQFQGVYLYQGGEDSARFRVTGVYPILPELQVGASIDFTTGDIFSESGDDGLSINELYVAGSIPDYPNLRFIVGQIDLTSYFDRNSFAKDGATHFFNPVFATNPALSAAGLGSRQGAVVNWTIIDELEAKAAVFSSDRSISDFEVNAFAGEIGVRLGNFILRGTYVTSEDAGANTGFEEIFGLERSNGDFGLRDGDREDAYGLNAELFIPEINLGLFARYGWYENRDLDRGATTYSFGINLLDLFMEGDRLGIGYGQLLSNSDLRDGDNPDVFEAFYDFRVLDFLRLGVTFQGLDEFSETIAGFRIRTDFDLVPRRTQ